MAKANFKNIVKQGKAKYSISAKILKKTNKLI